MPPSTLGFLIIYSLTKYEIEYLTAAPSMSDNYFDRTKAEQGFLPYILIGADLSLPYLVSQQMCIQSKESAQSLKLPPKYPVSYPRTLQWAAW